MRDFAGRTPRCALWADMGLGKTPTALQAIVDSLDDYYDTHRWLVVAPRMVAADAWPRQLNRWAQFKGLSWRNITARDFNLKAAVDQDTGRRVGLTLGAKGDKADTKRFLQSLKETVHLCSWDMLPWLVKAYGANWPYDGLVLDEAIFAANSTSERHKAAYHVIHRLGKVNRVIELCGAPTPNGYEQLHGQIRLLDPERLGDSLTQFRLNWMTPVQMGGIKLWKMPKASRPLIDAKLQDLCISLKTEDYLSLPPLTINRMDAHLPDRARELYDRMERDLVIDVDDAEILAPGNAALAGKLLQLANGAIYDGEKQWHEVHKSKLERLDEVLYGVEGPVLLAYNFQHDWERIKKHCRHAAHVHEPGALDKFRAGKLKLLCMQPAGGAHGLDGLQDVSSTAVWFGATFNADHFLQFNKRLHRDGQRNDRVVIHQILAPDTIEDYVSEDVLAGKISEQEALLRAVKLRITKSRGA